jgi:hypothetical protein
MDLRTVRAKLFFRHPVSTSGRTDAAMLETGWLRWQVLQIRQLQRLALEALLSWFEVQLLAGNRRDTTTITIAALDAIQAAPAVVPDVNTIRGFSESLASESTDMARLLAVAEKSPNWSPFDLMETIQARVREQNTALVPLALRALFVCSRFTELMQATKAVRPELMEGMSERLSLSFMKDTVERCGELSMEEFLRYVFENLILSQHFSVAARRFDGQTQRLRISIEEEGLTFLADKPLVPFVTPDRLATALSLMNDCGLLKWDDAAKGYTAV